MKKIASFQRDKSHRIIRIGIVGCGTIGSALAKAIESRFKNFVRVAYISDHHPAQISKLKKKLPRSYFQAVSIHDLIQKSDFIIEAASVPAARHVVPKVLERHKNILVMSVGGILEIQNLKRLLSKTRGQLFIPSGGIAGIDAVLAAKAGKIKAVRITTRKPLKSLQNSPYFLKTGLKAGKISRPTLIFQGTARSAIKNFPENVNVAVTLSLAGIGADKTRVRIFTSPTYRYNRHEIEIEGGFGTISTQVVNLPSKENPKTSALAVGSAIALLEKIFNRIKIGT